MSMIHARLRSTALSLCLFAVPHAALAANMPSLAFNTIDCDGSGLSGTIQFVGRAPEQMRWMWTGNNFYMAVLGKNGEIDNSRGQAMMIFDFLTAPRVNFAGATDAQGQMKQALIDISHSIIKTCWKRIGKSIGEFQKSLR